MAELNYEKIRAYHKAQFTKKYNALKKIMDSYTGKDVSATELEVLIVKVKNLREVYKKLSELHEWCISLVECLPEDLTSKELDYLDIVDEQMEEMTILLREVESKNKSKESKANNLSNENDSKSSSNSEANKVKDTFKIERIKFESFSGENPRLYLSWKKVINDKYLPRISIEGHGEALYSLLLEPAKSYVRTCDFKIKEMWKELDRRYGDKRKISSLIVNEIRNLPLMTDHENDFPKFVLFADKIQLAHKELGQFGKSSDLDNSVMLSFIEKKLPPKLKNEWSEKVVGESISDDNIFTDLLNFLKLKASAMEYQLDPLRSSDIEIDSKLHATGFGYQPREGDVMSRSPCLVHFRQATHDTKDCDVFKMKTPVERRRIVLASRACMMCFKRGHFVEKCKEAQPCKSCGGQHSVLLCTGTLNKFGSTPRENIYNKATSTSHVTGLQEDTSGNPTVDSKQHLADASQGPHLKHGKMVLPIQSILANEMPVPITALHDSGSTHSLILNSTAKMMNLESLGSYKMNITKTGGSQDSIIAELFKIVLIGNDGSEHDITAFGLKQISSCAKKIAPEDISKVNEISERIVQRPHGKIDLLIGCDFARLHPIQIKRTGNFVIGENIFGIVVWGNLDSVGKLPVCTINTLSHFTKISMDHFFQIEAMGVQCQPKCGGCKCGKCPIGAKKYTIKEECQLKWMMDNLRYVEGHWETTYPWIKDPKLLPNNYLAVKGQLASLERRLLKKPKLAEAYNEQVYDMISRGVAREITRQEMDIYKGPVCYLGHHPVEKPSSSSTPVRLVFNPAKSFRGHILNDYWTVGANTVQSLLDVLLRMREYEFLVVGDIAKMYHSVYTTELEWHTHRFLWRNFDQDSRPIVYIFMRNSFGDKPAGTIATAAIWKTVEKFGEPYPMASVALKDSIYVDDIVDSQPTRQLAETLTQETEELLSKGGFTVKGWQITGMNSGSTGCVKLKPLEEDRVLGLRYDEKDDCFTFRISPGQKPKKIKLEVDGKITNMPECDYVTVDELLSGDYHVLNKRMLVAWVNGIFDILGLASPFIVRAKILLRRITMYIDSQGAKLDWDDPIPETHRNDWLEWFYDARELPFIKFDRCISINANLEKKPILIMFSDASESAMGCCAYVRWESHDNRSRAFLVAAKSRIAPLNICSIVRLELQAAVMSTRLAGTIQSAHRIIFEKVIFVVDSEIVRAMISKDSYGFNTFVATRVGEIRENTSPNQWFWINGSLNIADWITRGKHPSELGPDSLWQKGPLFLSQPCENWPLKQSCLQSIPELRSTILITKAVNIHWTKVCEMIDLKNVNSFHKLVRVTARLLSAVQGSEYVERMKWLKGAFERVRAEPTLSMFKRAEMAWIIHAQSDKTVTGKSMLDRVRDGDHKNCVPVFDEAGVCRARGRVFNDEDLSKVPILLPENHRLSRLIVHDVHNRNHDGVSTVVTKVRERFWIRGVHRIAKVVRYKCVTCKRNFAQLGTQVLGELPPERLSVAAPFQFVALDYFGPFELKIPGPSTRGRTFIDEKQGYGVLFNCLSSRAVYCDVARGYSADGFMLAYRRFQSIHGDPDIIYSDCGSQLTAADKFLHIDVVKKWDRDTLTKHGVKCGTEWRFTTPDAPWQNGISESLIKGVKRSLRVVLGTQHPKLTYDELQTVLFEIANTLNERPIGRHPTTPDESNFLRPNDLLTGRCSRRIRSGPWDVSLASEKNRFHLVQQVLNDWEKRWRRDYFPTLLPRRIWHTDQRAACIGDLVIVKNSGYARGQWTLGQVSEVHPSKDGKVRNVTLRYKVHPPNESLSQYHGSKDRTVKRAVQSLVVISPVQVDDQ